MTTDQRIEELAQDINASAADVRWLAQGVAEQMLEHGVAIEFIEGSEQERAELLEVYLELQVKKSQEIKALWVTNDAFRAHMKALILAS